MLRLSREGGGCGGRTTGRRQGGRVRDDNAALPHESETERDTRKLKHLDRFSE